MVTKKKSTSEKEEKKGRVKVGKLKLNRETVKDLTGREQQRVKGGLLNSNICPTADYARCHTGTCLNADSCNCWTIAPPCAGFSSADFGCKQ